MNLRARQVAFLLTVFAVDTTNMRRHWEHVRLGATCGVLLPLDPILHGLDSTVLFRFPVSACSWAQPLAQNCTRACIGHCTWTMASLMGMPPELLDNILLRLEKPDHKQFRCVSHACAGLVTPLVFGEVAFDLELGGCDCLAAIARGPELRRHVRRIRLERRRGLKHFESLEDWCNATVYEYVPVSGVGSAETVLTCPCAMSRDNWKALSDNAVQHLYEDYEADERATTAYISRLASAASTLLSLPGASGTQSPTVPIDAQQTVGQFHAAVDALPNVADFTYTPAYENDERWGRIWRGVEFHPEGLIAHSSYGDDPDIDSLQLFITLRTIMLAPHPLQSVEIFTRGHAFWSALHLRRLLDWSERLELRSSASFAHVHEGLESWADDIGGPLGVVQYTEALTRHLVAWERSFSRLTVLECRIDTSWSNGAGEPLTIAVALSHGLEQAASLKELDLVFREDASTDEPGTYMYRDLEYRPHAPNQAHMLECVKVSKHLLASAPAFQQVRRLHLSFPTGCTHLLAAFALLSALRHLQLKYVALLPGGGQWETVLEWIAKHLRLDRIELRALEDVCDQQPRLLLHPEAPEWTAAPANAHEYGEYQDAILQYALRRSGFLPPLAPHEYLRDVATFSSPQ